MTRLEMFRLIADEGKILTDGTHTGTVVDVLASRVDEWTEIDAPEECLKE